MLMSISGIYATTEQVANGNLGTGGVEIKLQKYQLDPENNEKELENEDRIVTPGEVVSFIPKIKSIGDKCYIRAKIFYINNQINIEDYIVGLSSRWQKHGDYYYYDTAVNQDETIKLFDAITIPSNAGELIADNKIKIEITAEAVQEKNFSPDYSHENPWLGINPEQSINETYDIQTDKSKITITYQDGADEDISIPNNFFNGMKRIMPGDEYTSYIELANNSKENASYYLTFNVNNTADNENVPEIVSLLDELNLTITNQAGQDLYTGKMNNNKKILIGKYDIGQNEKLTFKITVPAELSNRYANIEPVIDWRFSVDYNYKYDGDASKSDNNSSKNKENPKTGDKINIAITIFLISSVGFMTMMFLNYKEKKSIE